MGAKDIKYQEDGRQSIGRGAKKLANAVGETFGPKGRQVILERSFGPPLLTKDGVTVAKEIDLKDPFENVGAQIIKGVASKTVEDAGDGTTTATILADAMLHGAFKAVSSGANPVLVKKGMSAAAEIVVKFLKEISRPVKNGEEIRQIATIAANNNKDIGEFVFQAIDKVGSQGLVTVEEGRDTVIGIDITEGMSFDKGYISPHFITNQEKLSFHLEDARILIADKKISSVKDILPILKSVVDLGRPFLIIAEDVEGEALATVVFNVFHGRIKGCCVKAPGFGDRRKEILQDIAILTGATVISEECGYRLEEATIDMCGQARIVSGTVNLCNIIDGKGDPKLIADRKEYLRQRLKDPSSSSYEKEKIQERLAKLEKGVAVIHVGAKTELEMKSTKAAVEDSVQATKSALEEGIVPGGSVAFLQASIRLGKSIDALKDSLDDSELCGYNVVRNSLLYPFKVMMVNAGEADRYSYVFHELLQSNDEARGWDALRGCSVNMYDAGIIDPTKVVRCAFENACSTISLTVMAEAVVVDIPKKDEPSAAMAHHAHSGMDY